MRIFQKKSEKLMNSPDEMSKPLKFLYQLLRLSLCLLPSVVFAYFVRGGSANQMSPSAPPSAFMGLEYFRADLFMQGFLPSKGYADPLVGPFISQMLATGEAITQALSSSLS